MKGFLLMIKRIYLIWLGLMLCGCLDRGSDFAEAWYLYLIVMPFTVLGVIPYLAAIVK